MNLSVPVGATGVVLFAHGSGSSRHSPRNQFVARTIREAGVGTLLFDLLTQEEEAVDINTRHLRFDIGLLAERLVDATTWIKREPDSWHLRVGYFGSSTGGGAALVAAASVGKEIGAVVSRGGRPDLAGDALPKVKSPTQGKTVAEGSGLRAGLRERNLTSAGRARRLSLAHENERDRRSKTRAVL